METKEAGKLGTHDGGGAKRPRWWLPWEGSKVRHRGHLPSFWLALLPGGGCHLLTEEIRENQRGWEGRKGGVVSDMLPNIQVP